MSTQSDGWIKMSERKPMVTDLPVWWGHPDSGHDMVYLSRELLDWMPGVFWQRAVLPEPPKKEMTQAEKDQAAFKAWRDKGEWAFSPQTAWEKALSYRDAQNREDLAGYATDLPSVLRVKRRCGLEAQQ